MARAGTPRGLSEMVGVGAVFFVAALAGLRVGLPGTSASPVWVAAGVSLAGTLLFGRHVLIGVFVAARFGEHGSSGVADRIAKGPGESSHL